ncbi:MAG TPA: SpoIVB peptidase S55 domain-containing protein, partial [Blastocatellia bacterium]
MKHFVALCLLCLVSIPAFSSGRKSEKQESDSQFMPVEDIKPGMKGYGITVFQGTKPERFDVEVLGILEGVPNPKQCSVIAKLSGPQIDRTSVFAGMSGSPVYIDGKLVGAVAFSYPFSKEPIAGITPIKFMIENFDRAPDQPAQVPQKVSFSTLIAGSAKSDSVVENSAQGAGSTAAAFTSQTAAGGLMPIATPVAISGVPPQVVSLFADELRKYGIQAVAGAGGGSGLTPMVAASSNTLAPGTSVSVQLVRGDFTLDAAGTVTYREGNKIYAFGHPFLSSGVTSWPMAESPVITVVPNINNSFKVDGGGSLVGSICQDRSTGVFGELGQKPTMIPVRVTVHTSRNKVEAYNFEMISDPALTPLLMKLMTFSSVTATERSMGSQTIMLNGRISIKGQPDLVLDNTFSSANGAVFQAVTAIEKPIAVLLGSGFDPVDITGINLDVTSSDTRASGTLTRLWVDKTDVHRGDTIEIQAFARNDNGTEF